jgi:hypothetical protein
VLPLGAVDTTISKATCRIVDRAMAYDPGGRFSSYDELIQDLSKSLEDLISGRAHVPTEVPKRPKWMILVAAGVLVVSAASIAAWIATRPAPEPVTITPRREIPNTTVPDGVDHAAEISRSYRAAREAAGAGNFQTAEREFGALHDNPRVQEPTRSWAGVESLLSAYLDARAEDAVKRAAKVRNHLATLPASHPLAGPQWQNLLDGLDDFRPLAVEEARSPASALAAAMLAGLKDWDQGLLEHAAGCFKTAVAIKLPPEEEWASFYQQIAGDYLHDHRILSGGLFTVEPADRAGCEETITRLDETLAALKTRGRARFNVRAWQLDLKRRVISYAGGGKTESPPEPEKPAGPSPEAVFSKLAEFTADRRFAECAAWLKDLPDELPGVSKQALMEMAGAASSFLTDIEEDLSREPFTGELSIKDGARVTGISVGADGSITATQASGGTRSCEWKDFTPDALIAIHRVLVKNPASETERLRRHECAIAFDWLAGNRDRSLAAAASLSGTSPVFKKRWDAISAGLPR